MASGKLQIVPLGGLGEFGMNCMALRWGDDIIIIDAGLMFPEAELLGVDIVVPDISYLIENRERVRGIILTHGHEDHIGALPWVLSELNVPVWGTEFTLAYVEDKLDEHGLLDSSDLHEIRAGARFKIPPMLSAGATLRASARCGASSTKSSRVRSGAFSSRVFLRLFIASSW